MSKQVEILQKWIDESSNIVFFGGAGVSTESGVPDFRSKDGLYNQHDVNFDKYQPEYLLSHSCLVNEPKVFYEYYRQKMNAQNAKPNKAHIYLAELEKSGKLKAVVTQNIDGLHQDAGSVEVYEIHGSTRRNFCAKCGKSYSSNAIFECNDAIPKCNCGMIRPEVTLYEEALPEIAVSKAVQAISSADMLIIGGTSLTVYPAAMYIRYFRGIHTVVVNKEKLNLNLDPNLDMQINMPIGELFSQLHC